nr:RecName: Full=Peroxidase 4 [Daucus carota]
ANLFTSDQDLYTDSR